MTLTYSVHVAKEKYKFSAAHFTLFGDGVVERLHGHNYYVALTVHADHLELGLVFPFHELKACIATLCEAWDEYVLLPTRADDVVVKQDGGQCLVDVATKDGVKHYSFPLEDVVLLPLNNISSENLAQWLAVRLREEMQARQLRFTKLEVALSESSGQRVTFGLEAKALKKE